MLEPKPCIEGDEPSEASKDQAERVKPAHVDYLGAEGVHELADEPVVNHQCCSLDAEPDGQEAKPRLGVQDFVLLVCIAQGDTTKSQHEPGPCDPELEVGDAEIHDTRGVVGVHDQSVVAGVHDDSIRSRFVVDGKFILSAEDLSLELPQQRCIYNTINN